MVVGENRTFKDSPHVFVCDDPYVFCREYYGRPFAKLHHFMRRLCEKVQVEPFGFHAIRHLVATRLYHIGKPLIVIQAVLRHKSAATKERYLKSLGLEETRVHLEDLCDMRKPVKDGAGEGAVESKNEQPVATQIINLQDHLEKRSRVVKEEMADKTVSETVSGGAESPPGFANFLKLLVTPGGIEPPLPA